MPPSPLGPVDRPALGTNREGDGVGLPRDYRDFIDLYGDGAINDELRVNYPAWQQDDTSTLSTLVDVAEEDNGYGVYEALEVPFPGYPAPGGLLRWAGNDNGDMLCWLTEGEDPDDWPVVVVFRHIRDPSLRRDVVALLAFSSGTGSRAPTRRLRFGDSAGSDAAGTSTVSWRAIGDEDRKAQHAGRGVSKEVQIAQRRIYEKPDEMVECTPTRRCRRLWACHCQPPAGPLRTCIDRRPAL
ncbi:hypothetical protein AB0H00_13740 [Nocardia sp. NPDC023852]|uniref:hypothetical protein n=1 Tax=Nocardia sp. NPDC023852 TaxID=3154697 RepID=UPI0033E64594